MPVNISLFRLNIGVACSKKTHEKKQININLVKINFAKNNQINKKYKLFDRKVAET